MHSTAGREGLASILYGLGFLLILSSSTPKNPGTIYGERQEHRVNVRRRADVGKYLTAAVLTMIGQRASTLEIGVVNLKEPAWKALQRKYLIGARAACGRCTFGGLRSVAILSPDWNTEVHGR